MMSSQNDTPLLDAVTDLIETRPAYFRIPGHRLERGISSRWTQKVGTGVFAYDVTETPATDDLHQAQGAIRDAQELLAQLYHARRSFFLVNGTTCGNEAMLISSAGEHESIMVARNAHKSAMMGLVISGSQPVYVCPEVLDAWGIQGGITPQAVEACFQMHPECRALFLVSPSYYGITSDISGIAHICHAHGALLLVDEAHGGHVYFHDQLPAGALESGADICVQSMHKVTGALTQSSVLHIANERVDADKVASALHMVQSTSPSYLLMTSLDCARYELAAHGQEMMAQALELSQYARGQIHLIDGFDCMGSEVVGQAGIASVDPTRLVITARALGLSGYELDVLLYEKYAVNVELSDYENVLAIVTYANTREDIERLLAACREISRSRSSFLYQNQKDAVPVLPPLPPQVMTPRQAYFAQSEKVPWQQAIGRIAGEMVAPYPPGIPILYAGERITREAWEYIDRFLRDGRPVHGAQDGMMMCILE